MSWRLVLGLIMAAVMLIRFVLLRQKRRAQAEGAEAQAARRFRYPADWPDERIRVPDGSSAVATSMIDKLAGVPGPVLSANLGGVRFRGVGFAADCSARIVVAGVAATAAAAGYRPWRSRDELTAGFESPDGRVCFYISLDTPSGPFTLWSTQR